MTREDRSFSTPRRVALVSEHFLPHVGGIERHVASLAVRLADAGHEVHVITSYPGPERMDSVRVHRVAVPLLPIVKVPFTPKGILPLETLLREEAFDLVHCHYSVVSPGVACAAYHSVRLGLPTLLTFHSVLNGYAPAFTLLDRWVDWSRWPLAYSAVSDIVAEGVTRIVPGRRVAILPNGVDREFWLRDSPPGTDGKMRVITTMRLAPRKRPRALLDLAHHLRQALPSGCAFELVIVGDGPERGALLKQIEKHDLGGIVRLMTDVERGEIPDLYGSSDVFVLPSVEESFGLAALEARCAGLPVVAMAESGLGRLIEHGREGLLARSDAELVGHLVRLMTDDAERAAITEINRSTAPPFAWESVLEMHLREYEAVIRSLGASGS